MHTSEIQFLNLKIWFLIVNHFFIGSREILGKIHSELILFCCYSSWKTVLSIHNCYSFYRNIVIMDALRMSLGICSHLFDKGLLPCFTMHSKYLQLHNFWQTFCFLQFVFLFFSDIWITLHFLGELRTC